MFVVCYMLYFNISECFVKLLLSYITWCCSTLPVFIQKIFFHAQIFTLTWTVSHVCTMGLKACRNKINLTIKIKTACKSLTF